MGYRLLDFDDSFMSRILTGSSEAGNGRNYERKNNNFQLLKNVSLYNKFIYF